MSQKENIAAEFAGEYGTVSILETVFQQVWQELVKAPHLYRAATGEELKIHCSGDWNRLEGPDFKNAQVEVDGKVIYGDIELHLDAMDWKRHGHENDPEYSKVVLHVFLFDSSHRKKNKDSSSKFIELSFLPYLEMDLEAYAEEMDLLSSLPKNWENLPSPEDFSALSVSEKRKWCLNAAWERWKVKTQFAEMRLKHMELPEVWHQSFLYTLGYPRNRKTMFKIAQKYPSELWKDSNFRVESLLEEYADEWKLKGQRPASQPAVRLGQYRKLYLQSPFWQNFLSKFIIRNISYRADAFALRPLAKWRKEMELTSMRKHFQEVLAMQWSGKCLDTLMVDVILPTLSANRNVDYFPQWFTWYSGNFPEKWKDEIVQSEVSRGHDYPSANGWNQAWIYWKSKEISS